MKVTLKILLRVTATIVGLLALFSLMVVAFFAAMDSSNIYVVVTDGMKARASYVITGEQANLTSFFTPEYVQKDATIKDTVYKDFPIRDFVYHLSINSLWCNPWSDKATVEVTESIPIIDSVPPEITPTPPPGETTSPVAGSTPAPTPEPVPQPPQWPRAKYKLTLSRQNDVWLISDIQMVKVMDPEPAATPEPTLPGTTASPQPTASQPATTPSTT